MTRTEIVMAEQIKAAIDEEGLTQAAFARMVGASEKHVSQVLTGKATARVAALDYWAFALNRHFVVELKS